jgi:shikimate kinase
MRSARPIALVGLMGSGKSAVAVALAARLGGEAIDLDPEIEAGAGKTIAAIFAAEGEAGFRRRESAQLLAALDRSPAVLACGGGAVLDPRHREWLRDRCRVVWLEVAPAEAARRIHAPADRPLLKEGPIEDRLNGLLRERAALYAEVAELRVSTDHRTPDEVADQVLEGLGLSRPEKRA